MKNDQSPRHRRTKSRSVILGVPFFAVCTGWLLSLFSSSPIIVPRSHPVNKRAAVFKSGIINSTDEEKEPNGHTSSRDSFSQVDDYLFSPLPLGCDFDNNSSAAGLSTQYPHYLLREFASPTHHNDNSTRDSIFQVYRQLTRQALKESKIPIEPWLEKCSLLIPISIAQRALLQETSLTAYSDRNKSVFSLYLDKFSKKHGNQNCILSSDHDGPQGLFLQLIACCLTRSGIPILCQSRQQNTDKVKELALSFGLAFYMTYSSDGNDAWILCGSSRRTRHSLVIALSKSPSGEEPTCISVDQVALDQGLLDSNFDIVLKHFFLNRYAVSVLRNEPLTLETTFAINQQGSNSSNKTLGVMVSGDGRIANGGDLFGPEVAKHILLTTKQEQQTTSDSSISVVIGSVNSTTPPMIGIVGSILQWNIKQPNLIHWGTGIIMDMKVGKLDPSSTIVAVRGHRTRDLLLAQQGLNPVVIGDPALLAGDFITPDTNSQQPMKDICFVIHGVDRKDVSERCPFCMERLVNNYDRNPRRILENLSCCQRVVSSSLHGVIFSHALGIPALPVAVGDRITGGDFKFKDYMHSVGVTSFQSRFNISRIWERRNVTVADWIQLVDEGVQPKFPIQTRHFYETFPTVH